jgi:hypothetical protein
MTATTDRELDLRALMGLPLDQRAHLDDDPHGQLRLDERCFFKRRHGAVRALLPVLRCRS